MLDTLVELEGDAVIGADEHARMAIPIVGRTGKDFGSGDAYDAIVEKATVTQSKSAND